MKLWLDHLKVNSIIKWQHGVDFQTYEVSKVSPEKGGQCCYFQSDWHWAVTLHSTELDSGLVANTGSSVTAAVQNNSVWKAAVNDEMSAWMKRKPDTME